MATYTDNYTMTKPTYAEQADISVINANMDIIDNVMHSSQISLAPAYDINETYNTGDIVMHELLMYKCLEDNVTGVWDSTKWTRTTAGEESGGGADLDIYGEASGTAEASFSDGAEASLVECEIGIVPTQDLHGYSKPWAGGVMGNLWIPASGSHRGIDFELLDDGTIWIHGTSTGEGYSQVVIDVNLSDLGLNIGDTLYNYVPSTDTVDASCRFLDSSNNIISRISTNQSGTVPSGTVKVRFVEIATTTVPSVGEVIDKIAHFTLVKGSSAPSTWYPYSNICPISGHTDVTVTVASTSGGSGEDTTVALGRTVYGGTLDVNTGVLTVNNASSDLGDLSWVKSAEGRFQSTSLSGTIAVNTGAEMPNMICSVYEVYRAGAGTTLGITAFTEGGTSYIRCIDSSYASATDFTNGVRNQTIVYALATPQTFNLTPTQVETLLGQNYVSHDGGGTISLVYIKKDSTIIPNPSDAEVPLTGLEISGKGFKITDARIPAPPTTNGAYVLTVTVSGGTPTYSWENA